MAKYSSHRLVDRPKASSLKPIRQALPFLKPYSGRLILALCCLTLVAASALGMPIAAHYVIDFGFSNDQVQSIGRYFFTLMVLSFVYAMFSALRFYYVMWTGELAVADIRSKVYAYIVKMSHTFYEVARTDR